MVFRSIPYKQSSEHSLIMNYMQAISISHELQNTILQVFPSEGKYILDLLEHDRKFNLALGMLYGAFLGDALGSHVEFEENITEKTMKQVMLMPGMGTFGTDPGQLTDDSELALELSEALLTYNPWRPLEDQLNSLIKQIAINYVRWLNSHPFDIGNTCKAAFKGFKTLDVTLDPYDYVRETQAITQKSDSESNGSIMRIAPMAVFTSYLEESRLTHSSPAVLESTLAWVKLLKKLIDRHSDCWLKSIYDQFLEEYGNPVQYPALSTWLKGLTGVIKQEGGWAKVAWSWGIQYLEKLANQTVKLRNDTYSMIVKEVISKGGDTDTNACIIGGLVGSVVGFKRLPQDLLCKMLTLDLNEKVAKVPRPRIYEPKRGMSFVFEIYKKFERIR